MKSIKTEEELQKVISGEKILLKFGAPWCAPCKVLNKVLEDLETEALINVVEVNIDEAQDLAMKYNVRSVPTTFLFSNSEYFPSTISSGNSPVTTSELANSFFNLTESLLSLVLPKSIYSANVIPVSLEPKSFNLSHSI